MNELPRFNKKPRKRRANPRRTLTKNLVTQVAAENETENGLELTSSNVNLDDDSIRDEYSEGVFENRTGSLLFQDSEMGATAHILGDESRRIQGRRTSDSPDPGLVESNDNIVGFPEKEKEEYGDDEQDENQSTEDEKFEPSGREVFIAMLKGLGGDVVTIQQDLETYDALSSQEELNEFCAKVVTNVAYRRGLDKPVKSSRKVFKNYFKSTSRVARKKPLGKLYSTEFESIVESEKEERGGISRRPSQAEQDSALQVLKREGHPILTKLRRQKSRNKTGKRKAEKKKNKIDDSLKYNASI